MARRASSGVNTKSLLIGATSFTLVLAGGFWFLNQAPAGFDAPPLDISRDVDNLKSLAGNQNSVSGTLIDRPSSQIVTLKLENAQFLSIITPEDLKKGNLNLQDDYTFLVEFNTSGVAVALDFKQN